MRTTRLRENPVPLARVGRPVRSLVWTVVVGVVLLGSAIVEHRSSDLPQPMADLGVEAPCVGCWWPVV